MLFLEYLKDIKNNSTFFSLGFPGENNTHETQLSLTQVVGCFFVLFICQVPHGDLMLGI